MNDPLALWIASIALMSEDQVPPKLPRGITAQTALIAARTLAEMSCHSLPEAICVTVDGAVAHLDAAINTIG